MSASAVDDWQLTKRSLRTGSTIAETRIENKLDLPTALVFSLGFNGTRRTLLIRLDILYLLLLLSTSQLEKGSSSTHGSIQVNNSTELITSVRE